MPPDAGFTITYWGITGTLPTPLKPPQVTEKIVQAIRLLFEQGRLRDLQPGPGLEQTIRRRVEEGLPFHARSTFGGNTTCLEVQTPDALLILDSGSGMSELGVNLVQRWNAPGYNGPRSAHVLLSHPHIDHILATPFVAPYYDPRNQFDLWGSRTVLDSLAAILSTASPLSQTFFPPSYDLLKALRDFHEVRPGDDFMIGSTRIRTYALHHPGGCLAYRLENGGRSFVFATDHEHPGIPDLGLAAFASDADVLYTDGQYTAAEYEGREGLSGSPPLSRKGWGHSSVEACVATAVAAHVRELHIGHREPRRNDQQIAELEGFTQELLRTELRNAGLNSDACRALVPYEGMIVCV